MSDVAKKIDAICDSFGRLEKRMDAMEGRRADATGHHVKTVKAHPSQGGHDIMAHATQYGVGDWRWGVKGSPYSAETSKSGGAPNKGEAFRRAKAELSAMMRSAQHGAESLRDGFLPGSEGYQKHEKVAAFYRKQV